MPNVFIAGDMLPGAGSAPVHAPWDGAVVADVGLADEAQLERAVDAAQRSARMLARTPSHRRRDVLRAIAVSIAARKEPMAVQLARESGKPIAMARIEVDRAVQTFSLGAEEATRIGGEALPLDLAASFEGCVGAWTRVPSGPVLAITPFNFPLNLVAHKLAPAFALGAPVVLKPAPQTPLTAMTLAEIVRDAGAPPGLLSVVPTSNANAERLVRDSRFAVVSFTGSAAVGWRIKETSGKKRVLLELGGNAATIVEPDADVEKVAERVVAAGYGYAGQVCIKTQRVFVHARIAEALTAALQSRVAALAVRDPMDAECVCGPMIDEANAVRVSAWLDEAVHSGARVLCGGARDRNRLAPVLVANAREGMRLVHEEVFGPVVTLHPYDEIDEAIAAIERGRYGLQAALFTHDVRTIAKTFAELHVGALIVNDATSLRVDSMPYGGVKDSGLGREGVRYAIEEMSDRRMLVVRG